MNLPLFLSLSLSLPLSLSLSLYHSLSLSLPPSLSPLSLSLSLSHSLSLSLTLSLSVVRLSIWSVSDGELVKSISHSKAITCIAYSRDSQYVTTGAKDTSLKVWDTSTGKLTQVIISLI